MLPPKTVEGSEAPCYALCEEARNPTATLLSMITTGTIGLAEFAVDPNEMATG